MNEEEKDKIIIDSASDLDLGETWQNLLTKYQSDETSFDPREHKDRTRSKIASNFTIGYFILMSIVLIGVPIYNLYSTETLVLKDILLTLSGILNGSFGFIVGYYFKDSENG